MRRGWSEADRELARLRDEIKQMERVRGTVNDELKRASFELQRVKQDVEQALQRVERLLTGRLSRNRVW